LLGDPKIRPDARAGYEAAKAAGRQPVAEGNVGAGAGATVGKILGPDRAMKGGLGSWAITLPDGLTIGALAAVNPAGDVIDPETGAVVAGARRRDGHGFAGTMAEIRSGFRPVSPFGESTVIGAVATNARLDKAGCAKVAQMAHDGLARAVRPAHTPWDGDTLFAISTGAWGRGAEVGVVGALAAEALSVAIIRAVRSADTWGAFPSAKDYR